MDAATGAHPTRYLQEILQIGDRVYVAGFGDAARERALAEACRVAGLDGRLVARPAAGRPYWGQVLRGYA